MYTIHDCNTQGFPALFNMKQNEIRPLSCWLPFHPAVCKFFNRLTSFLIGIVCVCVCSGISCMAQDCSLQMPEDFVLPLLPAEELKDKYRRYLFRDYVEVCVCGGRRGSVWPVSVKDLQSRPMRGGRGARTLLCFFPGVNLLHTFWPSASFPLIFTSRLWHHGGNRVITTLLMFSSVLFPGVPVGNPSEHTMQTMRFSSGLTSVSFVFQSHFQLQLCPGADCPIVIKVQEPRARRVQCSRCSEVFW